VADGAISYYIDHFVQTRVTKLTYGIPVYINYDQSNPEHQRRRTVIGASGVRKIDDGFRVILPRNKQVPETNEIRQELFETFTNIAELLAIGCSIYCYRGILTGEAFMDTNPELYSELCTIEVDLSHLRNTSSVQTLTGGLGVYYKVNYELVMLFGGTEIEAQLRWIENGVEKRSIATVLYTDNLPQEPDIHLLSTS